MVGKKKAQKSNIIRGHSRAARNRQMRRDALREELQSRAYVRIVEEIAERLEPAAESAYMPDQVPAAKARADIYFRLLDKCLPSLRPVDMPVTLDTKGEGLTAQGQSVIQAVGKGELTPSEGTTLLQALATQARIIEVDELDQRLSTLEERLPKR